MGGISLPPEIVLSDKTPRTAVAFDKTSGTKNTPDTAREVALVGQMTDDANVLENIPKPLTREDDGAYWFGAGSILDIACRAFFKANPFGKLTGIGIDDAGTPGAATVTFAETATISTTFRLRIGGKEYAFDVTVDDTPTVIGDNLVAITDADPNCVATGQNTTGAVVFTLKNGGTIGNTLSFDGTFDAPTDLLATTATLSGSLFAGGAGAVDPSDALASLAGHRYHVIGLLLDDDTAGGAARDHTDAEGDAEHNHGEIYLQCLDAVISDQTTLAQTLNASRGVLGSIQGSPSWVVEIIAALAAVESRNEIATVPRNNTVLPGILPPPVEKRWTRTETRTLLDNGCTPLVVLPGEQVAIMREVVTGVKNANGDFDYSTLDVTKVLGFDRIRDSVVLMFNTNYGRARWADSDPDGLLPTDVATPEKVTIDLIDVLRELEAEGIVQNVEALKDQVKVEKHGTQCWFSVPGLIVDGMHEKLGKVVYLTKLPLGT